MNGVCRSEQPQPVVTMTGGAGILVLAASLALSFFCSGMEAGVFALSRLRIRQQMHAGHRSAKVLYRFLEDTEDFLWTILVGNTLANFVAATLIVILLHNWLSPRPWLFLGALPAAVFGLYAVADPLPKMLFHQYPNRLCLAWARPFRILHLALSPGVALVAWLAGLLLRATGGERFTGHLFGSRQELRQLMQESGQSLSTEERAMVNRVLELQNLTVGTLAVPLNKVVVAVTRTPVSEVLKLCRQTGLTRLPLRDDPSGRVAGIFSLRSSIYRSDFDPTKRAGEFLQPALYLDESLRLETALQRLRQSGQRLAIVLDRDRREVGILTLQDILRFLFGEVSL